MPLLLAAVAGVLVLAALAALARTVFSVIVVSGPSMSPALRPGRRVLVVRRGLARLRTGRIVVVVSDEDGRPTASPVGDGPRRLLIKRLAALPGEPVPDQVRDAVPGPAVPGGRLILLGDNPGLSTDSRVWGAVPVAGVVGVVLEGVRLRDAPLGPGRPVGR
ncbi:S26 family signal peptidase [Streptomyces sp. BE303]|uniref:S26 family signal peptidase n=1 Tax=Streptomyces sp. BE303 TaxID=3002528 RepID=UPI002E75AA84|nr:S26 family signal peptidase [Streptomyces sp. BE303]MED7955118.1 S26 family signal peptidase [Streptomyces sp. BE303]